MFIVHPLPLTGELVLEQFRNEYVATAPALAFGVPQPKELLGRVLVVTNGE
jgi:hypothetical protein